MATDTAGTKGKSGTCNRRNPVGSAATQRSVVCRSSAEIIVVVFSLANSHLKARVHNTISDFNSLLLQAAPQLLMPYCQFS
jgi:hypothetical protein